MGISVNYLHHPLLSLTFATYIILSLYLEAFSHYYTSSIMLPCSLHAKHVLISSHVPILSPPSLLVYSHDNLHLPDFILLLVFRNFMKNRMSCFTIWYEQFGDL